MLKISQLKNINLSILTIVFTLCVIGAVTVFSTTYYFNKTVSNIFISQILFYFIGFIILIVFSSIHYSFLKSERLLFVVFFVTLLLLILVLVAGEVILGARRWISLGDFFVIQPSELAKVTLITLTAYFLSRDKKTKQKSYPKKISFVLNKVINFFTNPKLVSIYVLLIFVVFTMLQNSLGNSILLILIFLSIVSGRFGGSRTALTAIILLVIGFISGILLINNTVDSKLIFVIITATFLILKITRLNKIGIILSAFIMISGLIAPVAIDFTYKNILQEYQRNRVESFINPSVDAGLNWNREQSIIACGSGRVFGKGFLFGTQSANGFLPFSYTDFAYCGYAEQFGFAGIVILVGLFSLLIFKIIDIGLKSEDMFGKLLCFGVAAMIFTNSVQHMGMNIGLLPITGVPLPLISVGGSAIITTFLGLGLVMSVYGEFWNKSIRIKKINLKINSKK